MGLKPRSSSQTSFHERIQELNRRFRAVPAKGAKAEKLREQKDRLIDEMQASCRHGVLIEAPPDFAGFGPASRFPVRACLGCGQVEYTDGDWAVLKGEVGRMTRNDFIRALGKALRRIGINL